MPRKHQSHDDEAAVTNGQLENLLSQADAAGLYGAMILGKLCADCGHVHEWHVLSNISANGDLSLLARREALISLLEDQIEILQSSEPDTERLFEIVGRA